MRIALNVRACEMSTRRLHKVVTTTTSTTGDMLTLAFVNSSLGTKPLHKANEC